MSSALVRMQTSLWFAIGHSQRGGETIFETSQLADIMALNQGIELFLIYFRERSGMESVPTRRWAVFFRRRSRA